MHELHVFSGLGSSIFPSLSYGTRTLDALLDKMPFAECEHHVWNQWRGVADSIVNRWKTTKVPFKTVLIGHSNGVIAITEIARHLQSRGLPVDYIGAIDPTAARFPVISGNVEVSEFWASSGWPALTRRFTSNRRGACQFAPTYTGIHRLYHIKATHVGCASNARVHEVILSDVKRVLA
jgi:hypothetical protein